MNEREMQTLEARFLNDVVMELRRAKEKFPGNTVQYMALAEEFGELGNALIEHRRFVNRAERAGVAALLSKPALNSSTCHVWDEAVQTAAMAMRVGTAGDSSIPEYEPTYEVINRE